MLEAFLSRSFGLGATLVAALVVAMPLRGNAAKYLLDEIPMYGGQADDPQTAAINNDLIAAVRSRGFTPEQGSDAAAKDAWRLFSAHNLAGAMRRFNQAWVLDRMNGDVFHGFALTVFERDRDAGAADRLFRQGLAMRRKSPEIYLDYGRFLLTVSKPAESIPLLEQALGFPQLGADPQALLTVALAQAGQSAEACQSAAKVTDGAQPATRNFARNLLRSATCQGRR